MHQNKQKGLTLILLICAMVFLSIMAVIAFKFTVLSQQQVNLALLTERAKLAANSALEIAILQYEKNPNRCPEQLIIFDEQFGALSGFEVKLSCNEPSVQNNQKLQLGVYIKAEATLKDTKSHEYLVDYETGQWVAHPAS